MNMKPFGQGGRALLLGATLALTMGWAQARTPLVLMTDFGQADGAVSAMRGVAFGVDEGLNVSDLSHQIPDFDIWTGAYRLYQTANYWPKGSVFVTVVDPGVGTLRKSVVLKTKTGHYYVGPNNGLYTLVGERDGVEALREIDENVNRLPGSAESYTFHGRDVYAYTGARLASGQISFEQVGPALDVASLVKLDYQKPQRQGDTLAGNIPVLDVNFGNVWSNIPKSMLDGLNLKPGEKLRVRFYQGKRLVAQVVAPFENSFGGVAPGKPMVYVNSLLNLSVAINQGNFAKLHKIQSGADWHLDVSKAH
ncbi:SAM hydrolase/SAM-dependent halogenase family protein [Roseateles koreensis]|uniref:S-adenosyl-l-methionine hydroxide adenosyltransferase family protein n=1 Tax=Roseateles koreensis TaxID=2987526 RepID=A0ABT5KUG2_9BURK|nr:S-adenosyl-l-methionine hydroxide adenosyltransferase family protein [Roseateles koreensis]MDC8786451.1 S-adenosyl-l-methionine hydroxide adenosyltransferase family protein [Roseateles koreensis]